MSQNIETLRAALFETIQGVKNGTVDIDKARAVNDVAKTIVDTARVEVDYLKVTGGGESEFLNTTVDNGNLPPGITGRTLHRLKG